MPRRLSVVVIAATTACSGPSAPPSPEPILIEPAPTAPASLTAPGLTLSEHSWTGADESGGPAWVVRLPDAVLTVLPSDGVQALPAFPTPEHDSWVHINGGFYDTDGHAMSLVVHDGVVHHDVGSGSGILTGPHPVGIVHRDSWAPGPTEALQSIDRIVNDGTVLVSTRPGARRAARSVVGLTADGVVLAVLADERSVTRDGDAVRLTGTSFLGPTLAEAAEYAHTTLGAHTALNLDGAVSSALIVHTPAGRFTVHGEQPVINAVRLTPAP